MFFTVSVSGEDIQVVGVVSIIGSKDCYIVCLLIVEIATVYDIPQISVVGCGSIIPALFECQRY